MRDRLKYYKKEILSTFVFFITISLIIIFYLGVIDKKENYLLKYSIEYDQKLIDVAYYKLNIAPKFPKTNYQRGDSSFIECDTREECEEIESKILKLSEKINLSLWETTREFIKKEKMNAEKLSEGDNISEILSNNKKDASNVDQIFFYMKEQGSDLNLNSYRYLLNIEYLVNEESPNLLITYTNVRNNTWNHKFNLFFSLSVVNAFLSALFFLLASSRKSK